MASIFRRRRIAWSAFLQERLNAKKNPVNPVDPVRKKLKGPKSYRRKNVIYESNSAVRAEFQRRTRSEED
jgi:hypothetical protein